MRDPTNLIVTAFAVGGLAMWMVARFARASVEPSASSMPGRRRDVVATALGGAALLVIAAVVASGIAAGRAGCDARKPPPLWWPFGSLVAAWLASCVARAFAKSPAARHLAALGQLGAGSLVLLCIGGLALPPSPPGRQESRVIGDLRTVISGEEAFHSETGAYADLDCLKKPTACVEGYEGPSFLDETIGAPHRNQYSWAFHPGPARAGAERWKLDSYSITASPLRREPGTCCSFCGDSTGRICFRKGATPWDVRGAGCGSDCQELESHQH